MVYTCWEHVLKGAGGRVLTSRGERGFVIFILDVSKVPRSLGDFI